MRVFVANITAALLIAASSSGCSSGGSGAQTTTTLQPPTATLNPNRIPQPHPLRQNIGLGATWQMKVTTATFSGTEVMVALTLRNGSAQSITLPKQLQSMFTARDWLGGNDVAPTTIEVEPEAVASGATSKVTLTFTNFSATAKDPILVFRGAKLNDSLDAAVALKFAPKPAE